MGEVRTKWLESITRRNILRFFSSFVAGSPLLLHAQQDSLRFQDTKRVPGVNELVSSFDFETVFRGNVSRAVSNYTAMGVDSEFTLRRNREAFDWVQMISRGKGDILSVNTSSQVFGTLLEHPILIAPTSGHQLLHPGGEKATYQGATATKTPFIVSNVSSQPIEEIAKAANGPLWFQFYPKQDMDLSRRTLERAQTSGCECIVITIDQQASNFTRALHDRNLGGGRGRDYTRIRRRRTPPKNPYRVRDSRLWYEWGYLDQIHPFIKVPMLAKGVLSAEDALRCLDYGLDGIIVSNHGGRSVDYAPSSLEVLSEIVDVVDGRIPVLIDGGFRRGSDILKALALGADAVCLGRVSRWGLGSYGAQGVQRVIEIMQAELVQAMANVGQMDLTTLDRSVLRKDFP
jgi:4-hydroxymandelate oxidase